MSEIEKYLIEHKIDYYKSKDNCISVDVNKAMEEGKYNDYHRFCYELEKKKNERINNSN